MKLRHPVLLRGVGLLGGWLARWWMDTLSPRIRSEDGLAHPADPRKQRYLYAFRHEVLLAPIPLRPKADILISQSADGELIAQVCRHLGFGTVRGSPKSGGVQAMLDLIRQDRSKHIAVTPDGPRGPRRQVQPGLIFLASHSGLPIVAVGVGYSRAWRARSWDRFAVPMPWTGVRYLATAPLHIPPDLDREGREHHRQLVERELLRVTALAEIQATGQAECITPVTASPSRRTAA
jgi:lysophospholipid acyltransferase (LPLAT)-like uncharacterized protein